MVVDFYKNSVILQIMKIVLSFSEVHALIRNHYNLSPEVCIEIQDEKGGKGFDFKKLINEIDGHLNARVLMPAIKAYREATRSVGYNNVDDTPVMGLKESNDVIENWESAKIFILANNDFAMPIYKNFEVVGFVRYSL